MSWGNFAGGLAQGTASGVGLRDHFDARKKNREDDALVRSLQARVAGLLSVPQSEPSAAVGLTEQTPSAQPHEIPQSLIQNESGGDWAAQNNAKGYGGKRGHFGRLQFGHGRLQDYSTAHGIGPIAPQAFMNAPELQKKVEQWHFNDIDDYVANKGLDRYIGSDVGGVRITPDALRSMAHLGGNRGLEKFLTSDGGYNPADANGTRLSDYGSRHSGPSPAPQARPQPTGVKSASQPNEAIALYQELASAAMTSPEVAQRVKPAMDLLKQRATSELMSQFKGDPSTLAGATEYMRHYGRVSAMFGQPVAPKHYLDAAIASSNAQSAQGLRQAQTQYYQGRASAEEAELAQSAIQHLTVGNFDGAKRLAAQVGWNIGNFQQTTKAIPGIGAVPTIQFEVQTADGQSFVTDTTEIAIRLGEFDLDDSTPSTTAVKNSSVNLSELVEQARESLRLSVAGWDRLTPQQQDNLITKRAQELRQQLNAVGAPEPGAEEMSLDDLLELDHQRLLQEQ